MVTCDGGRRGGAGCRRRVAVIDAPVDPCSGQSELHILSWFSQGGVLYPLRCGRRKPSGWGYLHIRYDRPRPGARGHGDPVGDPGFRLEVEDCLARGVEAAQGGGNFRYTLRYDDDCTDGWGFRVVLAKAPLRADGHPTGVITAFHYDAEPRYYP